MAKELNFEQAMQRLDAIVKELEKGEVSLDDSMKLFEEGTALIRRCGGLLDQAEQQVLRLKKGPDEAPEELPFTPEN